MSIELLITAIAEAINAQAKATQNVADAIRYASDNGESPGTPEAPAAPEVDEAEVAKKEAADKKAAAAAAAKREAAAEKKAALAARKEAEKAANEAANDEDDGDTIDDASIDVAAAQLLSKEKMADGVNRADIKAMVEANGAGQISELDPESLIAFYRELEATEAL